MPSEVYDRVAEVTRNAMVPLSVAFQADMVAEGLAQSLRGGDSVSVLWIELCISIGNTHKISKR
jgi:hypothetical protein